MIDFNRNTLKNNHYYLILINNCLSVCISEVVEFVDCRGFQHYKLKFNCIHPLDQDIYCIYEENLLDGDFIEDLGDGIEKLPLRSELKHKYPEYMI